MILNYHNDINDKNQLGRLKEWVLYHNKFGIDRFIIFLDNCSDNSKKF
jgi:hypothetical protein